MHLSAHPQRYERRDALEAMDPGAEAHHVYREFALVEFPQDMEIAFHLSYCRPLAVPRMAELLERTGHSQAQPRKRAMDTALFMFELIDHGPDHERGREVIRALNRMHHRWAIDDQDYRYVLSTFAVVPVRWIDQWAWRATTDVERQANVNFYAEVGRRMNIKDMPPTYQGWSDLFDAYEAEHFAPSPQGKALMEVVQTLISNELPAPLRRLGSSVTGALLDPPTRRALGLAEPNRALAASISAALRLRAAAERRTAPRPRSRFHSGGPVPGLYPQGYAVTDLGPATATAVTSHDPA